MRDIFDAKVLCPHCSKEMSKGSIFKRGLNMRILKCDTCNETIVHPEDKLAYEHFNELSGKTFSVKMRIVGNSHTITIPNEIVNFLNEFHKDMRQEMDRVRLCFEDFGRLSVLFDEEDKYGNKI
jgi:hypothetical protein